jgi:hypothetical protein
MTVGRSEVDPTRPATVAVASSGISFLRGFVIAAGLGASILFVLVGLRYGLQEYGDGSIFSYSVAVEDAWAFHWHNISGRLFVYLFCFVPAEAYVAATGDARGGINVYGFLFLSSQFLGLAATFAADRSRGRIIFGYACFSTACLSPLVYGAPTEMWMAHALFWPALALCHYARQSLAGFALLVTVLVALILTHEGAVVLAVALISTALLCGWRDARFRRAAGALVIALSVWAIVKSVFPLGNTLVLLLLGALAGYGIAFYLFVQITSRYAHISAGIIVAIVLAVYWLWFDHALHAENRYYVRTALLFATPVLGALAVLYALRADGRLNIPIAPLQRLLSTLTRDVVARAVIGTISVALLVHAVETAKFVVAWTEYKAAVRALASGKVSDPALGDSRFVSADRIPADLQRLGWSSTTPFLSVLVAPNNAPARLVLDPAQQYFWLPCSTATENEQADRAIPVESRRLIRVHACLHR